MSNPINLKEEFPHLSKAPIVEAVLEIRVSPIEKWDHVGLQSELKKQVSEYPKIETLSETVFQIPPSKQTSKLEFEDCGCIGLKLTSSDNLNITQFKKTAFSFSRLRPYEDWLHFSKEAIRLWVIYQDLLKPAEIARVGLRFINRIAITQEKIDLEDYYKNPPDPLNALKWPLAGFLYHDTLQIPETPYFVNLIKTVQNASEKGLIIDIDVFTERIFAYDESRIRESIDEMRWIKNKIFFQSITENLLKELI
jgi:uncharacterized protein (TIGR04255 family)